MNPPVPGAATREMTIYQASPRAIIDWKSFNIAADAQVKFQQPSATASVLNRIYDLSPSVIQGTLSATGQVLLINQNGILFDRGSQVKVGSLVASTLNMSNVRFSSGALTTGGLDSPAFEGGYDSSGGTLPTRPDGSRPGTIGIGSFGAASLAAPSISALPGGSIMVFAPRIDNESGLISSPDGQVILAAGSKAYLALPSDARDTTLRGFQVEVEATGGANLNLTNLVRNTGTISADRGNVTLAALAINQDGRVSADTAIQANGSIFLKARTLNSARSGSVTLGAGSVTQVQPDSRDSATLPEGQSYLDRRGEIRVDGRTIASAGTLQASGGQITLMASDVGEPADARVYLDQGSITSVAGNWADLPLASNLLTFKVTSNELKNAPDQKTGILKGSTVTVDLRKGSPLLDLSGYIAAQGRSVAEKAAVGGDLAITSTGSLIQRSGATLDASGGGYRYGAGNAAVSQLLGDDGKIYSISNAPEQRTYTRVLDTVTDTDARFNQTRVFGGLTNALGSSEPTYVEGKPGGSIALQSKAGLILDGTLKGGVTIGPNQLAQAPRGAQLLVGSFNTSINDFDASQRVGNVRLAQTTSDSLGKAFDATSALSTLELDSVVLATDQLFGPSSTTGGNAVTQAAFGSVFVNSNGRITVPSGVRAQGAPGSSLTLRAPQIDIGGEIAMPAGTIALQPIATLSPLTPDLAIGHNSTTLHSGSRLSTAGIWINNASTDGSSVGVPAPSARLNPASDGTSSTTSMLTGGSVAITAGDGTSSTLLERGSAIDAGGGAALGSNRRLSLGDGGSISIANGLSESPSSDWLQATLIGLSPGNGAKLTISTQRVVIDAAGANGLLPSNTTRLSTPLFSEQGFRSISIATTQGATLNKDTTLTLRQKSRVIDPLSAVGLATGGDVRTISGVQTLPDDLRPRTDLTLGAAGSSLFAGQAVVAIAKGASIVADPKAELNLSAVDALRMDGSITAPGGSVTLTLKGPDIGGSDLSIGSTGSISVAGTFIPKPNGDGLVQGSAIDAGKITIAATQAGVNFAAGSTLDLSGLTQSVQAVDTAGRGRIVQQSVDANAGILTIRSQGQTSILSSIRAAAGSAQGAGGAFALELNARDSDVTLPVERRIVLTQARAAVSSADPAFVDATLSADALQKAGFQKIRLQSENRIEFRGDVAMDFARGIRLDAPLIDVASDGHVSLRSGSAVQLGQSRDPRDLSAAPYLLQQGGASPALATRGGNGLLAVRAGAIDLFGSLTLDGVSDARLSSEGDIRLIGRSLNGPADTDRSAGQSIGSLTTQANVFLDAAQIVPGSRTDYTIAVASQPGATPLAGRFIQIGSNGKAAADAYSAGANLTLAADAIVQGGIIRVPFGGIDLRAVRLLELSPGSVTSVSGAGLVIPYGFTQAGLQWSYQDNSAGGTANLLLANSADNKRIGLGGKIVDIRAGAKVDITGGGDLQASEFVQGSGGSNDVLSQAGTFAILPRAKLSSVPIDPDIGVRYGSDASGKDIGVGFFTKTYDANIYDRLYIGAGSAVPQGEYVLLPGRYALLPGAFMVQLQTGSAYANLQPGQTTQLINGQTVVGGYRLAGGTGIRESRDVGVVVQPGSLAFRSSDYTITDSTYFTELASSQRQAPPRIPLDAGHLTIANASSVNLGGSFQTSPGSINSVTLTAIGRSAEVDFSAEHIALVDASAPAPGLDDSYLQLDGAALSALGGSLLFGGRRSMTSDGEKVETTASHIVVANSTAGAIRAGELLLVATDAIDVRQGAELHATGTSTGIAPPILKVDSGGALLRLASGAAAGVDRGAAVDASRGDLRIEAGATLTSDGALQLDGTRSTTSKGNLGLAKGGSLTLASSQVSLGDLDATHISEPGLVLSNTDLAAFSTLDSLTIRGYQGIDLFGNAAVGAPALKQLTLDTNALRGRTTGVVNLAAQTILLQDTIGSTGAASTAKAGSMIVNAQRIISAGGAFSVSGFESTSMTALSEMVAQGNGSLSVAGNWAIATPKVGVAAGASQLWAAADLHDAAAPQYAVLRLNGSEGVAGTSTNTAAGGRLTLQGSNVAVATTVQARSGSIMIEAKGGGPDSGVTLGSGGVLDATGLSKEFNGNVVLADAGHIALSAPAGTIDLAVASKIDLSAQAAAGNAGSLSVTAQDLTVAGVLSAQAGTNGLGGRIALDLGELNDFSALNAALRPAGFTESLDLRLHHGDLRVAASDTVNARKIQLAADAGRVFLSGTLDASGPQGGGAVRVWARDGLGMAAGSHVFASGTSTDNSAAAKASDGGTVQLSTSGGSLDFDTAAIIDVSAGAKGKVGSVTFGVSRDDSDRIGSVQLNGKVLGTRTTTDPATNTTTTTKARVVLEAQRVYNSDGSIQDADITRYESDHQAFMSATDARSLLGQMKSDDGSAANASLSGAVEVRSAGDLRLDTAWNLTGSKWLASGEAGTLTLRAGGDLTLSNALGSPNDNIIAGRTWNLRMVGGADLAAANSLATQSGGAASSVGSVILSGDAAKLRTGTGRIEIAAANDFVMDSRDSVVYTAGQIGARDTLPSGNNRWGVDGGDILIHAGRDAVGSSDEWVTEWLRRTRSVANVRAEWWAYRPHFYQGVGTLAGGDILIEAGRNVDRLSAMLPTTGRSITDGSGNPSVEVQGGGNLRIGVGNDVIGGSYLVARGEATIEAGGRVGTDTPTQLYLMGQSSGTTPAHATVNVQAGGSIDIQSVNNPTAVHMANSVPARTPNEPSFGGSANSTATFFTYSLDSAVSLLAKSSDARVGSTMANARLLSNESLPDVLVPGAFPASLSAVALEGNVRGNSNLGFFTYPSANASSRILANGSVLDLGFGASEVAPDALANSTQPFINKSLRQLTGDDLNARNALVAAKPRVVERTAAGDWLFDIQALTGDISFTGADVGSMSLPAKGRIVAGRDVSKLMLLLQNLNGVDTSQVRAISGDILLSGVEMRGPGNLYIQAGRNVDVGRTSSELGGLAATGNNANPSLANGDAARLTVISGVKGAVDPNKFASAYADLIALNGKADQILAFFRTLSSDPLPAAVLSAKDIVELSARDTSYAPFVDLVSAYPRLLKVYQEDAKAGPSGAGTKSAVSAAIGPTATGVASAAKGTLPLGASADAQLAAALYAVLNRESNLSALLSAKSVADLVQGTDGGAAYRDYLALDQRYPRVFADYQLRRSKGALPEGLTPIVFSDALAEVVNTAVPASAISGGDIFTFKSSIQTYGNGQANGQGDINLWAPGGNVIAGLTTPAAGTTIGVVTNAGGAIRSVVSGDFSINQGKVLTAQGGDILIFSSGGSIDAGRGAKTSLSTPPPTRTPIVVDGVVVGFIYTVPSSAAGSGIQTLTSDPDGVGPRVAPAAGNVYLFAPAGTIDAGEAGIRSGGNLVVNALTVLNASNFQASGTSAGVPKVEVGSFASALAASGSTASTASKSAEENSAANSSRAPATTTPIAKPTILSVEVLGFGDKNCKEDDKDCFGK